MQLSRTIETAPVFRTVERALVLCLALGSFAGAVHAESCKRVQLTAENLARWYNPKPSSDDFTLPMPSGMQLVFTPVELGKSGLYGDEKSTYTMGAERKRVFETNLEVRVGSPIIDKNDRSVLLLGKYELSKGQYVALIGKGNLSSGLASLNGKSRDPRVKKILEGYLNAKDACYQVLTQPIFEFLSEPITFLSYGDYIEAIDAFNLYCIRRPGCQIKLSQLGKNPEYPGFVRLPSEHEWEFVARGGRDYVQGKLPKSALQSDIPLFAPGTGLKDYAHIGNDPARLLPIGSRRPLFGFYDLIGNAQELMQNPFTAENGYGAVGAYVARGGHYRNKEDEIRVSKRIELMVFRRDDTTKEFVTQYFPNTGIRLALGLPIVGTTDRTGSRQLAEEFAATYTPVAEAGDIAGSTFADAKDLGQLSGGATINVKDEVSASDMLDYYAVRLAEYATIEIKGVVQSPVQLSVVDEAGKVYTEKTLDPQKTIGNFTRTGNLLPGKYFVVVKSDKTQRDDNRYSLSISRIVPPDTGVARPGSADFDTAPKLSGGSPLRYSGFVGQGDRADTYPVIMRHALGGAIAVVSDHTGTLNVAYLDKKQNVVAKATSVPGQPTLELRMPVSNGDEGYVQVSSENNASSTYSLEIRAQALFDAAFATHPSATRAGAVEGRAYKGYLSKQVPRLYLPIRLGDSRKLRAELTELTADIDLDVLDEAGTPLDLSNRRTGTQPEFVSKNLRAGQYILRVTLNKGADSSPFSLFYDLEEYTAQSQGLSAKDARANATSLGLLYSAGQTKTINNKGELEYYSFKLSEENFVKIDLMGFSADSDLDLFLEDASGGVLEKSVNSGGTPESISLSLEAGSYFIRINPTGTSKHGYATLNLSALTEMRDADISWMGSLQEVHDDWKIYRDGDRCTMVTRPSFISPDLEWRRMKPYFYVSVSRGDNTVGMSLDQRNGEDVWMPGSEEAFVRTGNGDKTIWVEFENDHLKPLTRVNCSAATCIDSDAISAFRRGKELIVKGKSPKSGDEVGEIYSLQGYTRAAQRINDICGGRANWVWSN